MPPPETGPGTVLDREGPAAMRVLLIVNSFASSVTARNTVVVHRRLDAVPEAERIHGADRGIGDANRAEAQPLLLAGRELNVTTIEDPIEMVYEEFNQVAVNAKARLADTNLDITDKAADMCRVGAILKKRTAYRVPPLPTPGSAGAESGPARAREEATADETEEAPPPVAAEPAEGKKRKLSDLQREVKELGEVPEADWTPARAQALHRLSRPGRCAIDSSMPGGRCACQLRNIAGP